MGMIDFGDTGSGLGRVAPINPTIKVAAFGLPIASCNPSPWCITGCRTKPGKPTGGYGHCYAMHGSFRNASVQRAYARNYSLSFCRNFADLICAELAFKSVESFRVFVSGDFPHVGNADQWVEIVRRNPQTWFTVFTRKWTLTPYRAGIMRLAHEPNVTLMASYDPEMKDQGHPSPDVVLKGAPIGISYVDMPLEFLRSARAVVCPKTGGESAKGEYDANGKEKVGHPDCATCKYCYGLEMPDGTRMKTPRVYYVSHGGGYNRNELRDAQDVAIKLGVFPYGFKGTMKTWVDKIRKVKGGPE
jgi:hypothetical protein